MPESISKKEAAELLGVEPTVVHQFAESGEIVRLERGRGRWAGRYDRASVEELAREIARREKAEAAWDVARSAEDDHDPPGPDTIHIDCVGEIAVAPDAERLLCEGGAVKPLAAEHIENTYEPPTAEEPAPIPAVARFSSVTDDCYPVCDGKCDEQCNDQSDVQYDDEESVPLEEPSSLLDIWVPDPEIEAIDQVRMAMDGLSNGARVRIFDWAVARFDIRRTPIEPEAASK